MTRLAYPWALLILAALPVLWWLWLHPSRRPAIRFSALAGLRSARGSLSARLRLILPVLRSVALICLVVAVARPQRADETSRTFAEGVAILMVVDTSSSMGDTDLSPRGESLTRLDVVKNVFARFVLGDESDARLAGRPNDLIGMIRFARYADAVCPLTLDHRALLAVLRQTEMVQPNSPEDGTAIGDALGLAVERLRELKRTAGSGEQLVIRSRVVILLTDGENNAGMITPVQAGELAATCGIKVYTIMAGTGRYVGFGTRLPVDDRDLRRIAEVSGGRHFEARNAEALREICAEIDRLERTRVEERTYTRWGELSRPWMVVALACVALQALLEATWLRKIP